MEDEAFSRSNTINLRFLKERRTQHPDASLSKVISINHTMKYVFLLYKALLQTFYPLAMCCNYRFISVEGDLLWLVAPVLCIFMLSVTMWEAAHTREESSTSFNVMCAFFWNPNAHQ